MRGRVATVARWHPWALALGSVFLVVELVLASLWLFGSSGDQIYEPALVLFALLTAVFYGVSGLPTRESLIDRNPPLADEVPNLTELSWRLSELLKLNRMERRELLFAQMEDIYRGIRVVHRDYLAVLTDALRACRSGDIEEALGSLNKRRLFREPERSEIRESCRRLLARKWMPEVKKFLMTAQGYFELPRELPRLVEMSTRDEEEMASLVRMSTGYSRVIAVLSFLSSEGVPRSEAKSASVSLIEDALEYLRAAWQLVAGSWADLRVASAEAAKKGGRDEVCTDQ